MLESVPRGCLDAGRLLPGTREQAHRAQHGRSPCPASENASSLTSMPVAAKELIAEEAVSESMLAGPLLVSTTAGERDEAKHLSRCRERDCALMPVTAATAPCIGEPSCSSKVTDGRLDGVARVLQQNSRF